MSLLDRRQMHGPSPEWQHEFDTSREWVEYVGEKFFGGLIAGEPFLIVQRTLEHDSSGRSSPPTWTKFSYYVGILSDVSPLFSFKEDAHGTAGNPGFEIGVQKFFSYPGRSLDAQAADTTERKLHFQHCYYFSHTPVTKPFKPPFSLGRSRDVYDHEVEAFTVVCGMDAMEALVAQQALWEKDFPHWYSRAILLLGLPPKSEAMAQVCRETKAATIRQMRESHQELIANGLRIDQVKASVGEPRMENGALTIVTDEAFARIMTYGNRQRVEECRKLIKRNLRFACQIGLDRDYELLKVDSFRCQPAVVIEDFCALYGIDP